MECITPTVTVVYEGADGRTPEEYSDLEAGANRTFTAAGQAARCLPRFNRNE